MQLKAEIALTKDDRSLLEQHTTLIQQNANAILLKTSSTDFDSLTNRVTSAESSIVVNANAILSKVSSTDYNGVTIASLINQTADTIKIQAQHIQLEGIITANGNVKIETDGSITVNNGTFKGSIDTAQDIKIGVNLDMPVYLGANITELVSMFSSGAKGIRFGQASNRNAFIVPMDMQYAVNGTTGSATEMIKMKVYANNEILIQSPIVTLYGTTNKINIGGTTYTITRDSNGFLKGT